MIQCVAFSKRNENSYSTVAFECAQKQNGNQSANWGQKLKIALKAEQLLDVMALLKGFRQSIEIKNHKTGITINVKWLSDKQSKTRKINLMIAGEYSVGVIIEPSQIISLYTLLLRQASINLQCSDIVLDNQLYHYQNTI